MSLGRSPRAPSVSPRASLAAIERHVLKTLARSQNQVLLFWIVGGTTTVAVGIWHWRLVLATGSGIGAMAFAYWLQQQDLQPRWHRLRQQLRHGAQRQLVWATVCGGSTALGTYLMASVWVATANHWLATASLLQGTGILALLAWAGWQWLQQPQHQRQQQYERLIWDLADPQPLKRLMAIHHLTRQYRQYGRSQQTDLHTYFCVLLADEVHPQVREALLTALDRVQAIAPDNTPLQLPVELKARSTPLGESSADVDVEVYRPPHVQQKHAHFPISGA